MSERWPTESSAYPVLDRIRTRALMAGGVGAVFCLIGFLAARETFFRAYLFAFMFWLSFPLGCLALLMLQHLTGGAWGLAIRRQLEAGSRLLPLMLLLFVPIALGVHQLYVWSHDDVVAADPILRYKQAWLNVPAFLLRAGIYFAIWIGLGWLLNHWSARQDAAGHPRPELARRMQLASAWGLLLYVLTMTFAAFDWVMSIDPHWYSTIFGLIFIVGQVLGTLALMILLLALLWRGGPLSHVVTRDHFHDLGNLLMAFVLMWAYVSFSQYLIVWSGNLAEETPFYIGRTERAPLKYVALMLVVLHFAVPFALLLSRKTKRSMRVLAGVAALVVAMRFVDLFWVIDPMFDQSPHHTVGHGGGALRALAGMATYLAAPVAMGGLWIALLVRELRRRSLLPPHDPPLAAAPSHAAEVAHG